MNKTRLRRLLFGEFSFKRIVGSALFIYGFLIIYAMAWSDRIIFQPPPSSYKDTGEILKLTTRDGLQISAVYLHHSKATYTLLYSHGNAEDIGDLQPVLEELRGARFSVFAYDYHGYGTSQGKPTEANAYFDIEAAYDYLTQKLQVPPDRIIAQGWSVGSGPTVDLALRKPVAGLILESPFITAFRVLTHYPILPFDKFNNILKIQGIHCPVLVIHGKEDRTIPIWHGKKLFELAHGPKRCLWIDHADHNNFMEVAGIAYPKVLREFSDLVRETQRGALAPDITSKKPKID